jgi:hypothetical protein
MVGTRHLLTDLEESKLETNMAQEHGFTLATTDIAEAELVICHPHSSANTQDIRKQLRWMLTFLFPLQIKHLP